MRVLIRKQILFVFCGALMNVSVASAACATTERLPGREEMMQAFRQKQWPEFRAAFKKYCDDNASKIFCKVVPVEKSKANERMRELAKNDKCAETLNPGDIEPSAIYFTTDKNNADKK